MKVTLLFAISVALWGQQAAPPKPAAAPPKPADPVVLTIGTDKITKSMFEQIIATLSEPQQAQLQSPEARRSLAEQVAELKIMAKEGRTRKLDQSPIVKAKIALETDQMIAAETYKDLVGTVKPAEADVKAYYEKNKDTWTEAKARHILVRMQGSPVPVREGQKDLTEEEALVKIKDLRAKIVAGGSFADLAKAESDDKGSGENGGDLGSFGPGQMVPEFDEAAFKIPVGQVSDPIKTQYGYHLLLVDKRGSKSLEDARAEIEQKLKPEMGQKAVDALKSKTSVVYDEAYFGKDSAPPEQPQR
jgi:parvulin-like peptidyl-prolyl isomerase